MVKLKLETMYIIFKYNYRKEARPDSEDNK